MIADRLTMLVRRKRTLFAAVALPVLAFALLLSSHALQRCAGDGVARTACCCPSTAPGAPSPDARIADRCCCDSVVAGPTSTSNALASEVAPQPRPTLVAVLGDQQVEDRGFIFAAVERQERAARPPGVPLFILKRSFLI
jgi:hypothetical protein